ncbi:MAG: hypothetical protein ACK4IX_14630, partial [Candidatus Sericytochromatia bacterium]
MLKQEVCRNKPLIIAIVVLDLSKFLIYDFHYNTMRKKFNDCKVLYTDTDSLIYNIKTSDVYDDLKNMKEDFDFSEYPKTHELYDETNKKVIGKCKCETNGKIINEFVGVRAKMYSVDVFDDKVKMRAKGVKKSAMKDMKHQNYYNCLFDKDQHVQNCEFMTFKSKNHKLSTDVVKKISLSCYDDKRYYLNMIESRAHGHYLNNNI